MQNCKYLFLTKQYGPNSAAQPGKMQGLGQAAQHQRHMETEELRRQFSKIEHLAKGTTGK